ncbi:hypothetical protein IJU97_05465 [bacterium]|nr:hypothetical protein [bacterium]
MLGQLSIESCIPSQSSSSSGHPLSSGSLSWFGSVQALSHAFHGTLGQRSLLSEIPSQSSSLFGHPWSSGSRS